MKSLAAIKDEIRLEAEAVRLRTSSRTLPKSRARPVRRGADERTRMQYAIAELSRFPYTTFVDQAYRAVLKRPPDSAGFDAHVRLLISGGSKIEVLGNLRYSGEGRAIGVRIPRLLPLYTLSKIYRIPVVGYAVEWFVALAGLPKIVQHGRAVDTIHYSRSYEIDAAGRALKQEVAALRDAGTRLDENVAVRQQRLDERLAALQDSVREQLQAFDAQGQQSRHLVLSMNHWLTMLRTNLAALEHAEREQKRRADPMIAVAVEPVAGDDLARAGRLQAWAQAISARVPARARVLDLGSGTDWVEELAGHGFDVSGADANATLRERARAAGVSIAPGAPSTVLGRTADQALDVLTALAAGSLLRRIGAAALLEASRRVLKPGGVLLLGLDVDAALRADRLAGAADPALDADLLARMLDAAGFLDASRIVTPDGVAALLARNPQ